MRTSTKGRKSQGRKAAQTGKPSDKAKLIALVAIGMLLLLLIVKIKPPVTGNATVGVSLTISGLSFNYNCELKLAEGWNLISIPCTPQSNSVTSVLQDISGNYSIQTYDSNDQLDHWKSYKSGLPGWVDQDMNSINTSKGYWIRLFNSMTLHVNGTITLPTTVPLAPGWNLAGYPTNQSQTPLEAFASINTSIRLVYAYNSTDTSWKLYKPGRDNNLNDLVIIIPYSGYWINASTTLDWPIPIQ